MRHLLQATLYDASPHEWQNHVWPWQIVHIILIALIFLPISMYSIYKYVKIRKKMVIKKRSARIVILTSILIIFELLRRLWCFSYLTLSTYKSLGLCYSCLFQIEVIIYPLFKYVLMYSLLWRFFVIYYKSNWTQSIIQLKKIEEINTNNSFSSKKDWFIKYKSTIGNVKYNGKIFLSLYLSSFITSATLLQLR